MTTEPAPYLTTTKSGEHAIGLLDESYYLEVKRTPTLWLFRIQSFSQPNRHTTPWVKMDDFYKLETSRLAKKIRDNLNKIYPGEGKKALIAVIQNIELYESYWEPDLSETQEKEEKPSLSDILVTTALEANVRLFCDQHNEPHIQIPSEITLKTPESVTRVTEIPNQSGL